MDKNLEIRRPVHQKHQGLSTVSKIFFGVDIFQVVMVVTFQSVMVAYGNFNAFNSPENPGMGPGRRIYMCVFMGVVVYTCFLCLFAVKQQNILEILAFLLQNFGFVAYGLIQVYHVGYKEQPIRGSNATILHSGVLRNVALSNSLVLFLLNGVFIFLSWKLYSEFGWKIYKRVRFSMSLRSIYHFYQLLSCLLKMEILYWWMYAICNSFVLLRDTGTVVYYVNLAFIPLSVLYAGLGYIATQREIKALMVLFVLWTIGGAGYFLYKIYGFMTDTCNGCQEFHETGKDIHDEAIYHFVYLGSLNLFLLLAIFGVASKVFANFGKGLEYHFKPKDDSRPRADTDLYLRRVSTTYVEESVVSVTSYESDELNESMRIDCHQIVSTSAAPLIEPDKRALASSLPNLVEAVNNLSKKANTLPLTGERKAYIETFKTIGKSVNEVIHPLKSKLASIDEDDDLSKNDDDKSTDVKKLKRKESFETKMNGKWKNGWDRFNGEPGKSSDDLISKMKGDKSGLFINDATVNQKTSDNGAVAERDSGFIDCHGYRGEITNYGLKPILKTRKTAMTNEVGKDVPTSTEHINLSEDMNGAARIDKEKDAKSCRKNHVSLPRTNGNVKSKTNIFLNNKD